MTTDYFDQDRLARYADAIFKDGRSAIREENPGGKPIVFVARHGDVSRVLREEQTFSLAHYRDLFSVAAPKGIALIMAPETPRLKAQRELFTKAAGGMANKAIADAIGSRVSGCPFERRNIARTAVRKVLDAIRAREVPEFDLIGEYAYFVPYLVGRELFGLPGPAQLSLFARGLHGARRLFGVGPELSPETTPFMGAVISAQFAFAQVFKNFENRNPAVRWIAQHGAAAFAGHIRQQYDLRHRTYFDRDGARRRNVVDPYASSLLSQLVQESKSAQDGDAFAEQAVSLLVEMFGTILLIPPLAFSGIATWMLRDGGGIPASLEGMNDGNAAAYVDEFLRLNPPSQFLLRTAEKSVAFGDVRVEQGEYVCALVAHACRDPGPFPDPAKFLLLRPQTEMLHFGPAGGPHQCLGREAGRDLLSEMLLGLKSLTDLRRQRGTTTREKFALEHIPMTWTRERRMPRGYGPYRSSPERKKPASRTQQALLPPVAPQLPKPVNKVSELAGEVLDDG